MKYLLFLVLITTTLLLCTPKVTGEEEEDGGDDTGVPYKLNIPVWVKTKEQKKKEKQAAENAEENSDMDGESQVAQKRVVGIITGGLSLVTKFNDIVGTAQSVQGNVNWLLGLIGGSSPPATKEDIQALKNQISQLKVAMENSFNELKAAQVYNTIILLYDDFLNELQRNIAMNLARILDKSEPLSEEQKNALIKDIIPEDKLNTRFALYKIDEMIQGQHIAQYKDLYQAVVERVATCSECTWNLKDLPVFASNFNMLQAANYGAVISAYKAKGDTDIATYIEGEMNSRMAAQVERVYDAAVLYLLKQGSGRSYLRLQSARGGCMAHVNNQVELRPCDDGKVMKFKFTKNIRSGSNIYVEGKPCLNSYGSHPTPNGVCSTNRFFIHVSRTDPRYIQIEKVIGPKDCITANVDTSGNGGAEMVQYRSCDSDGETALTVDKNNSFWEFI